MQAVPSSHQDLEGSIQATVLIVEDDAELREALTDTLELADFNVLAASCGDHALQQLASEHVDLVISDVNMPGMDGHQLLEQISRQWPALPVLLMTAYGSIERSVSAMRSGAVDYICKPFEPRVLIDLVERHTGNARHGSGEPIAVATASRRLLQMARQVAATNSSVMLAGPSGAGKEVIARYIHAQSSRAVKPFIAINCAAIPETMLEATLFGHEKGAFTGAHQSAPGKFEQANGGTLLLDEISEMDLGLQAKLLRVIQEREVERVGGRKLIELDVRIIATTNRNLPEVVAEGKFREDLFYRLSVFPLQLPPLNARKDDVLPLARHLLAQHCQKMGRAPVVLTSAAESALYDYAWPGNVRELDNVMQRALILQPGTEIDTTHLLFDPFVQGETLTGDCTSASDELDVSDVSEVSEVKEQDAALESGLRRHEFDIIQQALEANRGSKKMTAEQLGISPRTLRYKLARMREQGFALP